VISCQNTQKEIQYKPEKKDLILKSNPITPFDNTKITAFLSQFPKFKKFEKELIALYQKHHYQYIWYDQKGIKEVGVLLYNKVSNIEYEGITSTIPYQNQLDFIVRKNEAEVNSELFISCIYFFYTDKVYKGLDIQKRKQLGWYLAEKKQSFIDYLDSILVKPSIINKDDREIVGQYYRLREVLKKYRSIEKKPWDFIAFDPGVTQLIRSDSASIIGQIRTRLHLLGDLDSDSKSNHFDNAFANGIMNYKKRNGLGEEIIINKADITHLNIPIAHRITTIIVNMERCRWISSPLTKSKDFVFINIPAFQLRYFENGEPVLESKVVVGKIMNKTVVFSADMTHIVFSPYWNIPKNILTKEVLPAIARNPNYLHENNMEWHEGGIRQRPGLKNALGVVKFVFPNSNSIYLHDTPAKGLFNEENRAFSHGCIRIEDPKKLAHLILKNDPNWTFEKIEDAMKGKEEKWYALPKKIPVYIGYFTAWVTKNGDLNCYEDIYQRDEKLATMLLE
jgi:murein L,D-transpeptidase YcbB/YkuD